MDYKTMINQIEDMVNYNHKDFVKAIISMEKGINDESALDKLYDAYMDNDSLNLLHEEFDYMIEDLREQGQIKDLPYVQEEKDNLINIVGNIAAFIPFGFFLPIISRRSRLWYNTVMFGFIWSLTLETLQLIFKVGSFDVDDMLLNTLGAAAGFYIHGAAHYIRILIRYRRWKQ